MTNVVRVLRVTSAVICLAAACVAGAADVVVIDETEDGETTVATVAIDKVWAGHPVDFCLLTRGQRQYIAYYNASRNMVVGQRDLREERFQLHILPATAYETHGGTSTVLGWDSHNSITLGVDQEGFIHLSGNMHVNPLTYFRSRQPHDISTLEQVMEMVGTQEKRCTYPSFLADRDGQLIFHYRDGVSGDGNEIYNIYSPHTGKWSRLLDVALIDGLGLRNAYQSQPTLLGDNWYHLFWVWRDTPDCATNHDLSYMKSPDLRSWSNAVGEPVELPATFDNKSLVVDPIPVGGGIINLAAELCLDQHNKPVLVYHKYGPDGNLQLFVAQLKNNGWAFKQITQWDYRWEFSGPGSIASQVILKGSQRRHDGRFEVTYWHVKYGNGTLLLDSDCNNIGRVIKPAPLAETLKPEGDFPGLEVRTIGDAGKPAEKGVRYLLKWETLGENRDSPRPEPWPEPSQLYLYQRRS